MNMTKKEFLKLPALEKQRKNILTSAIILYVCAAATLILGILSGNFGVFLDVAILLGFGLGIHLAQSRACAVIVCIYGVVNVLYALLTTGSLGGWLILVAAIDALPHTFKFHKAWTEYQQTGVIPEEK